MSDPGHKSPAERLLDIALYAPLGLAITVAESFPGLANKGRRRVGAQIGLARTVGQFAVRQGTRQLRGLANERPSLPSWPPFGRDSRPRPAGFEQRGAPHHDGRPEGNGRGAGSHPASELHGRETQSGARPRSGAPGTRRPEAAGGPRDAVGKTDPVAAAHLAIPSYDSLSASQVVQRLAGLSRDEVEAVRDYEAATRGRRTILARAEQLLT